MSDCVGDLTNQLSNSACNQQQFELQCLLLLLLFLFFMAEPIVISPSVVSLGLILISGLLFIMYFQIKFLKHVLAVEVKYPTISLHTSILGLGLRLR